MPPETNSEFTPENGRLEFYFPFGMANFQGRAVSLREGKQQQNHVKILDTRKPGILSIGWWVTNLRLV